MSTASEIAFAKWLQKRDPFLFRVAVKRAHLKNGQLNGFADFVSGIDWKGIASSAVDTVKNVAPALLQYKTQSKILSANLKRAQTGQPPIDYTAYQPTVKVAAEITPEMEAAATRVAVQSVKEGGNQMAQMLPYIALGVGAMVLLMKKR